MPVKFRKISRRRTVRKSKSTRAIAKRGLRVAKTLAKSRETKYSNQTYTTAMSTATGIVSLLSGIGQGDTASLRDGNKITLRSIRMQGDFHLPFSSANDYPTVYRVIFFQDRQQVGDTSPAVTDVLASAVYNAPYNYPSVQKRFKILYDRTFSQSPFIFATSAPAIVNIGSTRPFKHWVFPTMKQIYYNGANASDTQKNHVYMLLIGQRSTDGSASSLVPDLQFQIAYNDF